jgi:hypothetical protein
VLKGGGNQNQPFLRKSYFTLWLPHLNQDQKTAGALQQRFFIANFLKT